MTDLTESELLRRNHAFAERFGDASMQSELVGTLRLLRDRIRYVEGDNSGSPLLAVIEETLRQHRGER
jgi:hypothetical protein